MGITYAEAAKEVAKFNPKDNYIIIILDYSTRLVMQYDDGIKFIDSLKKAEQFDKGYEPTRIDAYDSSNIELRILSAKEYAHYKMAALLGITPKEVKEMEESQTKKESEG
jgi:hypothetical protein